MTSQGFPFPLGQTHSMCWGQFLATIPYYLRTLCTIYYLHKSIGWTVVVEQIILRLGGGWFWLWQTSPRGILDQLSLKRSWGFTTKSSQVSKTIFSYLFSLFKIVFSWIQGKMVICFYGICVLQGLECWSGGIGPDAFSWTCETGQHCIFAQVFGNKKVFGNIKTCENIVQQVFWQHENQALFQLLVWKCFTICIFLPGLQIHMEMTLRSQLYIGVVLALIKTEYCSSDLQYPI